jgi:murein L,D-transpeptidase YcbB/YkuD
MRRLRFLCPVAVLLLLAPPGLAEPEVEAVRETLAGIAEGEPRVEGESISSVVLLPDLYARRDFRPLWQRPERLDELLAWIERSASFGLDPADYHRAAIERVRAGLRDAGGGTPWSRAALDVLATDAMIRLAYHLEFGKVDPQDLDANWNMTREIEGADPVGVLTEVMEAPNLAGAFARFGPDQPVYQRMREGLDRYRAILARGGFEPVAEGPTLELGASGPRVASLQRRLVASGDLEVDASSGDAFDEGLEAAVLRFQHRHRIDADGRVGPGTLEALNVPVEDRIDQIRVNLERSRWVLDEIVGDLVLVDIAGFELRYYEDSEEVWRTRVQVGRPYRRTPVFRSAIRYLDVNPTWTVPPGILRRDILPKVRRNPDYLGSKQMRLFDGSGAEVDPMGVDWSQERFPYRFVQDPGPTNALGRIKFMFPNSHFVFLHDTPSRALFERTDRTFSSGCIRVEDPLRLAELLFGDPERYGRAHFEGLIESGRTQSVNLPEPVTVVLLYWTIEVRPDGSVHFKQDPYDRDHAILEGLEGEFELGGRPGLERL